MHRRSFVLDFKPDLQQLLGPLCHGKGDPTIRVAAARAIRATRTPEGPATTLIQTRPENEVAVTAWGPGSRWALEAAPDLLGAADDPSGFDPSGEPVASLFRRLKDLRIGRSRAVLETLLPTIIEQKVTGHAARRSYRGLIARYGEDAPGPFGLRLQPRPEVLSRLPYYEFHRFNIERKRSEALRATCHYADKMEEAANMTGPEAERRLRALPGIGVWTAAVVRGAALGDADAVEVGDYHIPSHVSWALAGERRGSDERMLELLEPYRGHRGRVVKLLHAGIAAPSRIAPRMYVADYSAM